ncbi:MAG TPA: HDOD domain-containing protein [Burkholderiaceae bacterium]|jgi:HD-like signal output (HDOD) protein
MESSDESAIAKLIKRMDSEPGFAGLGASVQVISSLDDDDDGGPRNLTSLILRDAALTSRLLRLANGSSRGTRNVSTIDQAIAILGFNTVRSVALSLALLDSLSNKPQSSQLHAEIVAAYFCGTLAASITRHNGSRYNSQEAQVCGLMQNLGRMMATYHLYEDIERSHTFAAEKNLTEEAAVAQVLGIRFDDIGTRIAEHWNLPDVLQQSLAAKAGKVPPRAASNAVGWHQMCALFSRCVTDAMFRSPESAEKIEINQSIAFFRQALQLKEDETHEWIEKALEETGTLLAELAFPCDIEQARSRLRKASERVMDVLSSNDSLLKGDAKGDGKKPVEVVQQVIRQVHDAFGFDLTLLCLPNGASGLVAIAGVGRNANQTVARFRCQGAQPDIFRLLMAKKVDLYVADIDAPSYAKYIPDWYREQVGASSFLIMSLVRDGQYLGMLYGDYSDAHSAVSEELMRGQAQTWRMQLMNVL